MVELSWEEQRRRLSFAALFSRPTAFCWYKAAPLPLPGETVRSLPLPDMQVLLFTSLFLSAYPARRRPLTEEETKVRSVFPSAGSLSPISSSQTLFQKLAIYIGSNLKLLIDRGDGAPSTLLWSPLVADMAVQTRTSSACTRTESTMFPNPSSRWPPRSPGNTFTPSASAWASSPRRESFDFTSPPSNRWRNTQSSKYGSNRMERCRTSMATMSQRRIWDGSPRTHPSTRALSSTACPTFRWCVPFLSCNRVTMKLSAQGFGVTARSTIDTRKLDPTSIIVFNQACAVCASLHRLVS